MVTDRKIALGCIIVLICLIGFAMYSFCNDWQTLRLEHERIELEYKKIELEKDNKVLNYIYEELQKRERFEATVTAYNTVEWQTDETPCQAAGGYICGRTDVVACPRDFPLHSFVQIGDKVFECMDRTARKYDGRFDISFDKDVEGAINFGKRKMLITKL